jgi:hypothetical protein
MVESDTEGRYIEPGPVFNKFVNMEKMEINTIVNTQ